MVVEFNVEDCPLCFEKDAGWSNSCSYCGQPDPRFNDNNNDCPLCGAEGEGFTNSCMYCRGCDPRLKPIFECEASE